MHVSKDPKYWDAANEAFYKKYHGLNAQHMRWKDLVVSGKPIEGPLGRSWLIPMGRDSRGEIKIPWTTLSNFPVQGTGADLMAIVRVVLAKRLKQTNLIYRFVSTVHDSIVIDAPTECLQAIVDMAYQVFDDLPMLIKQMYKYEWTVPMTMEAKFGMNMKDTQKMGRSS